MKFNINKISKNNKTFITGHKDKTNLYFIYILLFLGCLLLYKTNIINISALDISNKFLTKDKSIVKPLPKPQIKLQTKKKDKINSSFELKLEAALEREKNSKIKCVINEKPKELKGEKYNYCIKKSDIIKLGKYQTFENFPKKMIDTIKGCKTNICIRQAAGKRVYKLFVTMGERYHSRHPGDIIYGMAWFEILYLGRLKKAKKSLERYSNNKYEGISKSRKKSDEKKIYSLIKMNNSRLKMRNALGMTVYDDIETVLKNQWLLGDFLNNDKIKVKKVKIDPELKKRKLLLEKYKSTLTRYKKKLEEKKNNS